MIGILTRARLAPIGHATDVLLAVSMWVCGPFVASRE